MNACVPPQHQPCTGAEQWGADVACFLVTDPVGATSLNMYKGIGWSGTKRSLVLLKAEEAYEDWVSRCLGKGDRREHLS